MKVQYLMQYNQMEINYAFKGEIITATIDGITDIFDFSTLQHGDVLEDIETTLPINPIGNVYRNEAEVLHVKLLKTFQDLDTPKQDLFPDWVEV